MIINPSTLTNGVMVIPDDNVNIPGPALKFSGTTDAAAVGGKLIDSTRPKQVNPSIGGFTQTHKLVQIKIKLLLVDKVFKLVI